MKIVSVKILNITTFAILCVLMLITFQINVIHNVEKNGIFLITNSALFFCILTQLINYIYEANDFKFEVIETSIFSKVLFYKFCIYFTNFIIEGSLVYSLKILAVHNYDICFLILAIIIIIFHIAKISVFNDGKYRSLFSIGQSFYNHINAIMYIEQSKTLYKLRIEQYKNTTW